MEKKLSDVALKAWLKTATPKQKLFDGGGLYLFISPSGTPLWRIKYRYDGKEKTYSAGMYPTIGLAAARLELRRIKGELSAGRDPVIERRITKADTITATGLTFEVGAQEWLNLRKKEWGDDYHSRVVKAFERDVYPVLGKLPIDRINPPMVAQVTSNITARGAIESAKRILRNIQSVFEFAAAKGYCKQNPAMPVSELLPKKYKKGRFPALLTWPALGEILRSAHVARSAPSTKLASRLTAFTAARIANVVAAEWQELDLGVQPVWIIPRHKMKKKDSDFPDHRIPLAHTIAEELRQWQKRSDKRAKYVFPSTAQSGHITEETIEKFYRITLKLSGKHCPHGWRSSFLTLTRENGHNEQVTDLALDHAHDNEVARAYDRGERFEQRMAVYNWWGERLDMTERGETLITKIALDSI